MSYPGRGDIFEDRFRIEEMLGEGAFAKVWRARDTGSDRPVALKVLEPDDGRTYTAQTRARFQREVQIIGGLRDPHTVKLFNYGESRDGLLYLVFEHLEGQDLSELIRQQRLSPDAVLHIVRQVLSSLREAHQAGMIHRDLKPENIRITTEPNGAFHVTVIDFGIARATDAGHPSLTKTGELVGTPRYMSPEQLFNSPLTAASDIFSLGLIMFELLAGPDAIQGGSIGDQLARLRSGQAVDLRLLPVEASGLGPVLARMTAANPEDRFPSVAAVLAALQNTGPFGPAAHAPAPQAPRPTVADAQESTNNKVLLAVAGAVVALLAAIALVASTRDEPSVAATPAQRPIAAGLLKGGHAQATQISPVDAGRDASTAEVADMGVGSEGCGQAPPKPGLGVLDETLTYIPSSYDPEVAHPLLMLIHGDYQEAHPFMKLSGFIEIAEREGLILIAPQDFGATPLPGAQTWLAGNPARRIRRAYRSASRNLCVDTSQTFIFGHAAGARIAMAISCEGWLSGIALSGFAVSDDDEALNAARGCTNAVPAIVFYPKNSPHIGADRSPNCMGISQRTPAGTAEDWQRRNGCEQASHTTVKRAGNVCQRYQCGTPFEMCILKGGTLWPDGIPESKYHRRVNCDGDEGVRFAVAEHSWEFFKTSLVHDEVSE